MHTDHDRTRQRVRDVTDGGAGRVEDQHTRLAGMVVGRVDKLVVVGRAELGGKLVGPFFLGLSARAAGSVPEVVLVDRKCSKCLNTWPVMPAEPCEPLSLT